MQIQSKNDRFLSAHIRQCQRTTIGLASVAEQVEQHEAYQWQVKQHRVSSVEPLEVTPEVEESMDIDFEVSFTDNALESRCLIVILAYQDNGQPDRGSPPSTEVFIPPIDAPTPSTSYYGHVCQLPSRYQDIEINLHEVGPGLSHIPNSKTLRQQGKEADKY